MSVKPILFNTEMVRAILDGRKTVTRRLIKNLPKSTYSFTCVDENLWEYNYAVSGDGVCMDLYGEIKAPYQPGDILYVRETWHIYQKRIVEGDTCRIEERYGYKANVEKNSEDVDMMWKPSIHMPKEAARIFLKVTDIRVEKLQEITSEQICREGVETEYPHVLNGEGKRYAFSQLWDSTIKKSDLDRYGWEANPWVWVIEFERCEKPESD